MDVGTKRARLIEQNKYKTMNLETFFCLRQIKLEFRTMKINDNLALENHELVVIK